MRALRLAALAALLAAPLAAEPAQRVLSVGGAVTETVFALGAGDRVVARDTTSTWPPEVEDLPDVGYVRRLSPEGVLSVAPDLILAEEGAGPPETVRILEAAEIPFVTIPDATDAAGVAAKIEAVGAALGLEERAADLAAEVQAEIAAIEERSAGVERPARVLFLLSAEGGRLLASGTETAADAMIRLAGGANAVTGFTGYKPLTDEAVLAAAPDVVLMMEGRAEGHGGSGVLSHPALAATPAGRDGRLVEMNGLYLLGFGPRTAQAVADLHRALYPGEG
ncbi:hemin ABC transporter substrate-binding protein [Rhodosalinus halophilus]|uniref:Hemin ABC transporter substrate-binding protein n=1 Tax=Rhodosalinus halophilus TaxID=2259333 RepID=A0A365U711_9RHOB|nr:ABC transporter substrate-binding protein [Rhodosalinus halophilus]RBI83255.1 hemin ABC transporter substrate-binding protein [Rhodosalinus halophilus]